MSGKYYGVPITQYLESLTDRIAELERAYNDILEKYAVLATPANEPDPADAQEVVEISYDEPLDAYNDGKGAVYECPNMDCVGDVPIGVNYCPNCGKRIRWVDHEPVEEQEPAGDMNRIEDWENIESCSGKGSAFIRELLVSAGKYVEAGQPEQGRERENIIRADGELHWFIAKLEQQIADLTHKLECCKSDWDAQPRADASQV